MTYHLATGRYVVRNLLLPAVFGIAVIGCLAADGSSVVGFTIVLIVPMIPIWFLRQYRHPPLTIDDAALTTNIDRRTLVIPWDDIDPLRSRWAGSSFTLFRRSESDARAIVITTSAYEGGLVEAFRLHLPASPAID